jgi:7-cyano-7-deazaguanine reductase
MFKDLSIPLAQAIRKRMLPPLETFPCPYATAKDGPGVIRIIFPEFTCVCPKTGYPDFAAIKLYYLPCNLCIELKSWKLYLNAFRMMGTFHETVIAHLYHTVKKLLNPRWIMVIGDFSPRGNVDTTVVFESPGKRPAGADVLIGDNGACCASFGKI